MKLIENKKGFSIVELVVAIALLGGLAASASSFVLGINNIQKRVKHRESALRTAQNQMETLRNEKYNTLENGVDIDFTSSLPDDLPPNKSGTVSVSEPMAGIKRVDVVVSYQDGNTPHTVKLSSLIGQIGLSK
jgi:prepilin-type N-terminal cleavage/methylation domain-containing protein